ncbi:hypothetical protein ABW20_dc0106997 [Dactylellina cionopaga]|nr:hypothetical protein ABW20_dc0106997 [Dactylellina cionopaga]
MTANSLVQFREMTIRPVHPEASDDEGIESKEPKSSLSTPPRTPTANEAPRSEPRTANHPLPNRTIPFAPTSNPTSQPISGEKTIEYRTRARAIPHSPSSSTDETIASSGGASTATLVDMTVNTSQQSFRGRAYAQQQQLNSSAQSSPSSPLPPSASPSNATPAQISTTIYSTNSPVQRPSAQKSSGKLYKSRTLKNQSSNGTLTSLRTSESLSNLRSAQGGDAGKVLSLMKEIQGKMEGNLEYKIGDGMTWTKGFCTILDETGRLVHIKDDKKKITVIGDLRGCQIRTSGGKADEYEGIIEVSFSSRQDVKLRPLNAQQYDSWLAALLCWQPIRPAGPNNKMVKTQPVRLTTDRKVDRRRNSDATSATSTREAAIIKVGKMMLWDRNGSGSFIPSAPPPTANGKSSKTTTGPSWRKISCILQENGDFKLYNETDVALLHVLQLSSFSRSAIQILDSSVHGLENCIGIYPHYSPYARFQPGAVPIYLTLDTKILFEVWFVLLRAYTVPELYGPAGLNASAAPSAQVTPASHGFDFGLTALTDAFRVPRLLNMRIIEAKFPGLRGAADEHRVQFGEKKDIEFYFEVIIDGDIRARSMPRVKAASCMWMEQFEFNELPSQLNVVEFLQDFTNGLTIQLAQMVSADLRRLAHTFLKIFQVSGKAVDWLMMLAEAEIGGLYKNTPVVKHNFPIPGVSTNADIQQSQVKPDPKSQMDGAKRAQMEANLLFRGNSLLTKAVEAHLKGYGQDYMEETIGEHIQRIAEEDTHCEVDPMKCKSPEEIRQNWKLLNSLVRAVWRSIANSGHKCPTEVKKVLYHIRLCVEEKFDGVVEGPTYSSVSGFVFLRFFCPALMNPKMFGILKDHPGAHAQRTLTLLAKSLQGLANMTTFGVKEPWFEPMNEFVNVSLRRMAAHPPEVHSFQVPPSYATPITIQARLQQASKEGFPSLPFLIDQPRAIGRLVQMWLSTQEEARQPKKPLTGDVLLFHEMCLHLKERMTICVERAENAERPSSSLSNRWEAVAESVASSASSTTAVWDNGRDPVSLNKSHTAPTQGHGRATSGPANMKNGNGLLEEDAEFAGIAAIGKNKLTKIVGGKMKRETKQETKRELKREMKLEMKPEMKGEVKQELKQELKQEVKAEVK